MVEYNIEERISGAHRELWERYNDNHSLKTRSCGDWRHIGRS